MRAVSCPACQQRFASPDGTVTCPHCGEVLNVAANRPVNTRVMALFAVALVAGVVAMATGRAWVFILLLLGGGLLVLVLTALKGASSVIRR